MNKFDKITIGNVKADFTVNIIFTETQARILDAIVGYGGKAFLEVFEEKMGKHYIREHREHVEDMFNQLRTHLSHKLSKIDKAKQTLAELNSKA